MVDKQEYWVYDIILKSGVIMESVTFLFNFSKAMEKPGYFNGAIFSDHDRIFDIKNQRCILYGEIAAWNTIFIPESDTYPET